MYDALVRPFRAESWSGWGNVCGCGWANWASVLASIVYMKGCIEHVASFCSASLQIAVYQVSQPISAYLHAMIRREIARGVETLFFIAR